jgi:2-acylglycerol O-acyltransferase 2
MPAPTSEPLNAEPAKPEERETQHLPPKSYADAVEEAPPVNGANGSNGTGSVNRGIGSKHANGGSALDELPKNSALVLRIVDMDAPEKEGSEKSPEMERQESKQEYSATVGSPTTLRWDRVDTYCS